MSRFCCCGSIMQEAVLDTSEPASREIAKSLNMLFGGIDLDPTDRLFAALLVAEHQSDQRQRNMRHMLSRAGYVTNMQRQGAFIKGSQRRDGGQLSQTPEPRAHRSVSWHLPPSPFSSRTSRVMPMYRRTMMKLDEVALEEGGRFDDAMSGTDSPSLKWVREQLGTRITLAYQYAPIITPVCLPAVYCDHLTPQEAADIYSGLRENVPVQQLRQAQSMSLYAIAAYGLQNIAWGRGKRPPTCAANITLFRKCMSKVFRLQDSYRQRNCEAILEVTGSDASDLLFVSYANTSGGALPYLVMRHRPSNSLVISIRGTVSMEDLITDLLSQPVDVSDWLPPWVQEAQSHKGECMYAHAGVVSAATAILLDMEEKGLLKELLAAAKRRALLSRMSTRYSGEGAPGSQTMDRSDDSLPPGEQRAEVSDTAWRAGGGKLEAFFTIDRVRTLLRQESGRTMKLAVTGHSLGAAVACMLSFQLHQECPDLHCWAFCPPGGLMSWNLSVISRRFCTSLVVGKDAISRLSFNTVKRMVDEMVVCLARCRRPKLVVLSDLILRRRGGNRIPPLTLCDMDEIPEDTLAILERYFRTSLSQGGSQPEMYPPGSVMFLRPFKSGRKKTPVQWDAVWINAADLMGEGLHISPAMMLHHRLYNLTEAFESFFAMYDISLEGGAVRTPATKPRIRRVLGKCCV
uniref:sn-1-specific diacylglycerol lipase n=1 Tax=Auxenochlorella protothecoides TaxID=3075 RepID=A0A1D2A505_AUXPR